MTSRKRTSFVVVAAAAAGLFVAGQPALAQQQGTADQAQQQSNPAAGIGERANQAGTEAGQAAQNLRNQGESAVGTVTGTTGAGGQEGTAADRPLNQLMSDISQDPKTAADKLFVLRTIVGNRAEINLARQVADKTQNQDVKKQAQQLADDLRQENQKLMQTAQAVGLTIPQGMHEEAVREARLISKLPADQLDKRYTAHVQARNAQELSRFQSEAAIAEDPQVKQFAQQQLQAQQTRTQQWNQVAMGMGLPGGGEAQPAGATIGGQGAGQQQPTNENR